MEQIKEYEYVDLGLPSGLKWATMNVGATSEADYGSYFQWGDIEDKSNSDYSWESYKYCNGTYKTLTKYCTNSSYGTVDDKTTLEPKDDAAIQIMGGNWRMPTSNEFQELFDNTTKKWIEDYNGSGINGMKFTSNTNGNSIFFPASGYAHSKGVANRGLGGYYWSSSLHSFYSNSGLSLDFSGGDISPQNCSYRISGFCVRGVFE